MQNVVHTTVNICFLQEPDCDLWMLRIFVVLSCRLGEGRTGHVCTGMCVCELSIIQPIKITYKQDQYDKPDIHS